MNNNLGAFHRKHTASISGLPSSGSPGRQLDISYVVNLDRHHTVHIEWCTMYVDVHLDNIRPPYWSSTRIWPIDLLPSSPSTSYSERCIQGTPYWPASLIPINIIQWNMYSRDTFLPQQNSLQKRCPPPDGWQKSEEVSPTRWMAKKRNTGIPIIEVSTNHRGPWR